MNHHHQASFSTDFVNPLPLTTNFRLFQTERVCKRQFQIWWKWKKVIQMGRKLCGKRRNCIMSNFSFSHSVFKRLVSQGRQKSSLCGKALTLYHTISTLNDPEKEAFWKHCGKRRKCWLPAFSPLPTMFSTLSKTEMIILVTFVVCKCFEFGPV